MQSPLSKDQLMSQQGVQTMKIMKDAQEDHIYFDLNVFNSGSTPIPASFFEVRASPYITNPSSYNVAVARFRIPADSSQILTFPNPSPWYITLTYLGVDYTQNVVYVPTTQGYLVFTVEQFLQPINVAFQNATTALNAVHPGTLDIAPFMVYNSVTGLFTLVYSNSHITNNVDIYWTANLYLKFDSMPATFYSLTATKGVQFLLGDFGNNTYIKTDPVTGTQHYYLSIVQDGPNPSSIADLDAIAITSNTIPLVQQNIADESTVGSNNTLNILTDFLIIETPSFNALSSTYTYNANLYRLQPLISTNPLATFDLSVFLRMKDGTLQQVLLYEGQSFSIKIVFIRKGLTS